MPGPVDRMDMSALDAVLEEFPGRREAPRSTVARSALFVVVALATGSAPAFLYVHMFLGFERWGFFAVAVPTAAVLLARVYQRLCLANEKLLIESRARLLFKQLRGKRRSTAESEEIVQRALERTASIEAAAFALWTTNLAYLGMFLVLFALSSAAFIDVSGSTAALERSSVGSYLVSSLTPAILLGAICGSS